MNLALFISFILMLVIIIIKYYFGKRRLFILGSRLPGPRPLPIVGNGFEFARKKMDILTDMIRLNKKYEFLRLWLGHRLYISISTPEDAKIYFRSRHLLSKDTFYEFFEPFIGKGLMTANGDQWKRSRKFMETSFRYSTLQSFNDKIMKKADILLECLEKEGKQTFSVFPYIKKCSFDVICDVGMNWDLNPQREKVDILEHADELFAYTGDRILTPWQHFDFLYKFCEKGKVCFRKVDIVKKFINSQIKKRIHSYNSEKSTAKGDNEETFKNNNLLGKLIESDEWDDDETGYQIMTIIITGYETTATSISFALLMLGIHKDVQEKLYNELSSGVKEGTTEKNLPKSEYLEMILKETLRLYPIVPFIVRKADEGIEMGKFLIPKGASVAMNIFMLHRNPKEYDNPDDFNPDNFLPENVQKRHPSSFVPFAMGVRNCIGNKLSMMTMAIIISKIILNYKIECDLKMEDIKLRFKITLKTKNQLYPIRLIRR